MKKGKILKNLALVSQLAISIVTPILLCLWVGGKLDEKFNKNGIFSVIFIVIGAGAGFLNLLKMTGLYGKKDGENEDEKRLNTKDI